MIAAAELTQDAVALLAAVITTILLTFGQRVDYQHQESGFDRSRLALSEIDIPTLVSTDAAGVPSFKAHVVQLRSDVETTSPSPVESALHRVRSGVQMTNRARAWPRAMQYVDHILDLAAAGTLDLGADPQPNATISAQADVLDVVRLAFGGVPSSSLARLMSYRYSAADEWWQF
jgi:hypothetical protein